MSVLKVIRGDGRATEDKIIPYINDKTTKAKPQQHDEASKECPLRLNNWSKHSDRKYNGIGIDSTGYKALYKSIPDIFFGGFLFHNLYVLRFFWGI